MGRRGAMKSRGGGAFGNARCLFRWSFRSMNRAAVRLFVACSLVAGLVSFAAGAVPVSAASVADSAVVPFQRASHTSVDKQGTATPPLRKAWDVTLLGAVTSPLVVN